MPEKVKTRRYTLDLNEEQLRFLKLFALQHSVHASIVMRALIYLLETDADLQYAVIDEIYPVDREPYGFLVKISNKQRGVKRYTVDLHPEQTNYLNFITINQGIKASILLRTMIYLLETDEQVGSEPLSQKVLELIVEEEEDDEE